MWTVFTAEVTDPDTGTTVRFEAGSDAALDQALDGQYPSGAEFTYGPPVPVAQFTVRSARSAVTGAAAVEVRADGTRVGWVPTDPAGPVDVAGGALTVDGARQLADMYYAALES